MTDARIVVGLGNPGDRYADHRHNVGFRVLDELARRRRLDFATGDDGAWTAAAAGASLVLVKPLTYMNRSGSALAAWARSAGVRLDGAPADPGPDTPEEIPARRPLVVCDDLALPLGSLRLRRRGSSGGQNGLASIIERLGGGEFPRLRLGIAPRQGEIEPAHWPDFVLEPFAVDERETAAELVQRATDAVEHWVAHGLEDTISRFNRRVRPTEED